MRFASSKGGQRLSLYETLSKGGNQTELGQKIDIILAKLQMDQKSFCERTGVSSSTISGLRKGSQRLTKRTFDLIKEKFPHHANILYVYIDKENSILKKEEEPQDKSGIVKNFTAKFNGVTLDFEFATGVNGSQVKQVLIELGVDPAKW